MSTRLVAPLILAAVLLLAWAALRPSDPAPGGPGSAPGPGTAEQRASRPAESRGARLEAPERGQTERAVSAVQPPAQAGRGPAMAESGAQIAAGGRVVLHRPDGQLTDDGNGVLNVMAWSGAFGSNESIQVVDGRFELALDGPPVDTLQVFGGTLDGRSVVGQRAEGELSSARVAPEAGVFELHCEPRGSLELEVFGAESGLPLVGVDVARIEMLDSVPGLEPDFILRGGRSPLTIDPGLLTAQDLSHDLAWWAVRAPDHAWRKVSVRLGGERKSVQLRPGGTLAVDVQGAVAGRALELYFESAQSDGVRYGLPLEAGGEYRLESVPAGEVRAAVQRGGLAAGPTVFGEAAGTLVAGKELRLAIEVAPEAADSAPMHEVRLEIAVPAGWELETLRVWMDLVVSETGEEGSWRADLTPDPPFEPGRPTRFACDLGTQPQGTWLIELPDIGWRKNVEIDHSGRYTVELPAPAIVTVTVTDPSNGQPVEDSELSWYAHVLGPTRMTMHHESLALDGPGQHRLIAPAGLIDLDADSASLGSSIRTFSVVPGEQAIDMPLTQLAAFGLTLMDRETPVTPQPADLDLRMTGIGFDAEPAWTAGWHRDGTFVQRRLPGRYELALPELPGYLPVEARVVELVAGTFEQLVIQLQRRP